MGLLDRIRSFLGGGAPALPTFGSLTASPVEADPVTKPHRSDHSSGVTEAINPTEEFELALGLLREGAPFVMLTGQAGTGKTTCIRWLRQQLGRELVVVAPTGIAALTAGGQTIHSFFGFAPRWIELDEIQVRHERAIYEALEVLVIDEISMVRCDLVDAMDRFLRLNRARLDPSNANRPFGGVQVLAVGDLFQLPPVVKREDRSRLDRAGYSGAHFFFSAKALQDCTPTLVELTKPFRQTDARFLELLSRIREGNNLLGALEEFNRRCHVTDFDRTSWLTVLPTRAAVEAINEGRLNLLPGAVKAFDGILAGQFLSEAQAANPDDHDLPAPFVLRLKPGARVIFTKNDPESRWVNGTMGTVARIGARGVTVHIDGSDAKQMVDVVAVRWKKERHVFDPEQGRIVLEEVGSYTQLPLALAWAITIHKVQGQTVDQICVDLAGGAFAPGQAYVALSRCRSMDGLRLTRPVKVSDVLRDPQVERFMARIREFSANRILDSDPVRGAKPGDTED